MKAYRLYAKGKNGKRYSAMDYNAGTMVSNLTYATLFNESQLESLKSAVVDLNKYHDGEYHFEIREV